MESRGLEDSKNVKTSQAYFFEGFISFFEDFSLTMWNCVINCKGRVAYSSTVAFYRYDNTNVMLTNMFSKKLVVERRVNLP